MKSLKITGLSWTPRQLEVEFTVAEHANAQPTMHSKMKIDGWVDDEELYTSVTTLHRRVLQRLHEAFAESTP